MSLRTNAMQREPKLPGWNGGCRWRRPRPARCGSAFSHRSRRQQRRKSGCKDWKPSSARSAGEFQDKLDLITAGNTRLSQCLAERDISFRRGPGRGSNFWRPPCLRQKRRRSTSEAEGLENGFRTARDQLQGKLDLVTAENARLSQSAIARDVALGDARARNGIPRDGASAAEAECTKLSAEVDGARGEATVRNLKLSKGFLKRCRHAPSSRRNCLWKQDSNR